MFCTPSIYAFQDKVLLYKFVPNALQYSEGSAEDCTKGLY